MDEKQIKEFLAKNKNSNDTPNTEWFALMLLLLANPKSSSYVDVQLAELKGRYRRSSNSQSPLYIHQFRLVSVVIFTGVYQWP